MASETAFQTKFIKPLAECYGQQRFPNIRIQKLWEKLKPLPDHILGQCVERIVLNFDNFPGVQGILNTCAEVSGEFTRQEAERLKASIECSRCRSQGVVVANNYAYKCTCQLGELLYPAFPLYRGQVHVPEKIYTDEEGNRVYESASYRTVVPSGCRNLRLIKTVVKDAELKTEKPKASPQFKTVSFDDFLPPEGA